MINKKILFIGYGEIAQLCAKHLLTRGFKITALSRTLREAPYDAQPDQWQHIKGNVTNSNIQKIITKSQFDSIVVTLTPKERSDKNYKYIYPDVVSNLKKLWDQLESQPRQLIYITSTSVYGQSSEEVVNEDTQPLPEKFNGKRLLEAENIVQQLNDESGVATTCVRFAGIYGPNRYHLLNSVLKGHVNGEHYTNRIHVEDCAGLINHLIEKYYQSGWYTPILIGSDSLPVKATTVRKWLYKKIAQELDLPKDIQALPAKPMGNKRCSNRLLLESGYRLKYPDYTSGFEQIIIDFCKAYKNKNT